MKIIPKNKRAKDRIRQHGENMILIKESKFAGQPAIFVRSEGKTWSGKQHWFGWFTIDEIDYEFNTEVDSSRRWTLS